MSKVLTTIAPFSMLPHKITNAKGLSATEFRLLITLISYCNPSIGNTICWPRQKLLADKVECSIRQVIRLLKSLESKGFVIIHENFKQNKRSSNVYEIPSHFFTSEIDPREHKIDQEEYDETDYEKNGDISLHSAGFEHENENKTEDTCHWRHGGGDISPHAAGFETNNSHNSEKNGDISQHSKKNGDTDVTKNGDTDVVESYNSLEKQLVSYSLDSCSIAREEKSEYRYSDVCDLTEDEIEQIKNQADKSHMSNEWVREVGDKFASKFQHNVFYNKQTFMNSFAKLLTRERTDNTYSSASPRNKQTNKQNNFNGNSGFATNNQHATAVGSSTDRMLEQMRLRKKAEQAQAINRRRQQYIDEHGEPPVWALFEQ